MTSRRALLAGMTVMLVASTTSTAGAADELGLSVDGVTWSSSITDPLFDASVLWVPGDSETATFYLRNQGGTPADLTVDILGSTMEELLDTGDLHVTAKGGGGTWVTVSEGGEHRLLTRPDLADGESIPIDVTVTLDAASTNASQVRSADLSFRIVLAQAVPGGAGTEGGSTGGGDDGSPLPGIGSDELRWLVIVGAVLVGGGLGIVARRRESESEESHV